MKLKFYILASALLSLNANAAEPDNYYSSCENKSGQALLSALHQTVSNHTAISYDGLWDLFKTSDVYPDGKIWDMYSTKHWSSSSKCGNYSEVGSCYNREHSFPKSWFNDAKPMYTDAFHLYPTDGYVNGHRSNLPFGECANGIRRPSVNGIDALGKVGKSTFKGYSGEVFEPDDQYKGDFARSYFYMAAAYNDRIKNWSSDMLARNSYPAFSNWAIQLLLKWHRQDPVSEKEINRNEVVYGRQHNRNPFIDHPELAEYIWGDKTDLKWSSNTSSEPQINSPADGSTIDFGITAVKWLRSITLNIRCSNLKENLSISCSGDFACSQSSISAGQASQQDGVNVMVSFKASVSGKAEGNLILKSGELCTTVKLRAEATDGLPLNAPYDISDRGFTISWTNIGDSDDSDHYSLHVCEQNSDTDISAYPKKVNANAEICTVDDLMPSTDYVCYLTSQSMISHKYSFTTADPIPSVILYHDGDLYLTSDPGEPGEPEELEVEVENISGDIEISVTSPFEISTDHSNWSTSLKLREGEDRLYIRLNGDMSGDYMTSIVVRAEGYYSDRSEAAGSIGTPEGFHEDFEPEGESDGTYTNHTYAGSSGLWNFSNAGIWSEFSHDGDRAVRMGKNNNSYIEMASDATNGIGTVSLWAMNYKTDGDCTFELRYTTDNGASWQTAGNATTSKEYREFTFVVNQSGNVRLRIAQTSGKRWNLDDITTTGYRNISSVSDPDAYHSWDAWNLNGRLVVNLSDDRRVLIYGSDGIIYADKLCKAGENMFELASGLYLVAVNGRVRRVVI